MKRIELRKKIMAAPEHVQEMLLDLQEAVLEPLLRSTEVCAVIVLHTREGPEQGGLCVVAVNADSDAVGSMLYAAASVCTGALSAADTGATMQ